MKCINCGSSNEAGINFCIICGAPLTSIGKVPKKKMNKNKAGFIIALLFFLPIVLFILFLIILYFIGINA